MDPEIVKIIFLTLKKMYSTQISQKQQDKNCEYNSKRIPPQPPQGHS